MRKLHSTGGFWLGLGALLLAASLRLLFWGAVACLVHELGHWLALRLLGGRVEEIRLTGCGAVLRPEREKVFSYGEECLLALAGPAASFLLALVGAVWGRRFGGLDAYLLTGVSLTLGVFNLLPAGCLDGGRVLRAVLSRFWGPHLGQRVLSALTGGMGALLAGLGLWAVMSGGNVTMLLCGGWLMTQRIRQRGNRRGPG